MDGVNALTSPSKSIWVLEEWMFLFYFIWNGYDSAAQVILDTIIPPKVQPKVLKSDIVRFGGGTTKWHLLAEYKILNKFWTT